MPLSQSDRITFSQKIVTTDAQLAALDMAKAQLQVAIDQAQALDDGNQNLSLSTDSLIVSYQAELSLIDGNGRTTFSNQDVLDSASKKLGNFFFPNNVNVTVPSLASSNNIWANVKPFALGFGIGKNYSEAYATVPGELPLVNDALALISSASAFTDIQNTTGQHCEDGGVCSLPQFTTEADCTTGGGTWTDEESITTFDDVQTLKTNLAAKVQSVLTQLTAELTAITTNDSDSAKQTQNQAAIDDINNNILPALNAWIAYSDFNTAHGQTTCAGFNSFDANSLAPTKLHSAQLTVLQAALMARQTFLTTRSAQLNTNLGTVNQDVTTGDSTGTGLYYRRYQFLSIRLNAYDGSATKVISLSTAGAAQDGIKANITDSKNLYLEVLPTSAMQANASDTNMLSLVTPTLFQAGDQVFIMADDQTEIVRGIKSIQGSLATLSDTVPSKYRTANNLRIYKDLT